MAYSDIDSGKVLNKEGLLELCSQIKAEIANNSSGSGAGAPNLLLFTMRHNGGVLPEVISMSNSSTFEEFISNLKTKKIVYVSASTSYTFKSNYKITPALLEVSTLYAMNCDAMSVVSISESLSAYGSGGVQVYFYTYYYFDGAILWSWKRPGDLGNNIMVNPSAPNGNPTALGKVIKDINIRIPVAPTTDGTYTLQCVVSSGTPTYSWVSA